MSPTKLFAATAICASAVYFTLGFLDYEKRRAHNVYNSVRYVEYMCERLPIPDSKDRAGTISWICDLARADRELRESALWPLYPLPAIQGRVRALRVDFAIDGTKWEVTPDSVTRHDLLAVSRIPIIPPPDNHTLATGQD